MKGSFAGPPTLAAPIAPPETSPPDPGSRRERSALAIRGLWDDAWLPAGSLAVDLLRERCLASCAAVGLGSEAEARGIRLRDVALEPLLAAARALHASLGWETVAEHVVGPDRTPSPLADLVTPRAQAGAQLVLHAEHAGVRWEVAQLTFAEAGLLQGLLCEFTPTLSRLADQGHWPGWLAPVQIEVLPVGAAQAPLADELCQRLRADGLRVELSAEGTISRRVRDAVHRAVPGLIVLGADEMREGTVALRWRGEHESLPRATCSTRLRALLDSQAPQRAPNHTRPPSEASSSAGGPLPAAEPSTGVVSH